VSLDMLGVIGWTLALMGTKLILMVLIARWWV
jgi:hypothetical protein